MATEDFDPDNVDTDTQDAPEEKAWLKDLRRKADEYPGMKKKLESYELRDKLSEEAGIKLTPKQLTALLATHEGEQTPEALKATATELGFYKPEPDVAPDVQAAHEAVAQVSQGAQTQPQKISADDYANAKTPEEVLALVRAEGGKIA
jgi:hypothetical protein